jgi:hypothetical protein
MEELEWKEGIIAVLNAANAPMHYVEIAEQIFERGLRMEQAATPAATVAATIAQSFKNDGEHSPFIRLGKGVYALRGLRRPRCPPSRASAASIDPACPF